MSSRLTTNYSQQEPRLQQTVSTPHGEQSKERTPDAGYYKSNHGKSLEKLRKQRQDVRRNLIRDSSDPQISGRQAVDQ